jgi:hypothetical protein
MPDAVRGQAGQRLRRGEHRSRNGSRPILRLAAFFVTAIRYGKFLE